MSSPIRSFLPVAAGVLLGLAGAFLPASLRGAGPTPASAAFVFVPGRHVVALNQVGFETSAPKRFTAPVSPDGSRFTVHRAGGADDPALFAGEVRGGVGDFSAFQPEDATTEYQVVVQGGNLETVRSDPFAIRKNLWQEEFWKAAVDFMVDCRSVVGTHPSAYGGCPWRDGTYYDHAVPSLVELFLADPGFHAGLPRQVDWAADRARVLAPGFVFDAKNPHSEGVMEAVRRYYEEIPPPAPEAPDAVKLIHWGLGFYLVNPATRDPSQDPLPRQIHGQTVEQFAFFLHAWPELRAFLPRAFYDRCRDFTFAHWRASGLLAVSPHWDPAAYYQSPAELDGARPGSGMLQPYKGRHAPGHSILPNLLLWEVARREEHPDAADYLRAAQTQAQWIVDHLDWEDPLTTKGHRMSEQKTVTGLAWFVRHHPAEAPAGLREKIAAWGRVMVRRSANFWDFRRYDEGSHWTIPRLNEPGNVAGFPAAALAAASVVEGDEPLRRRLREIAVAQMDNLFGRNPQLATAANHPQQGFPRVERGWPWPYPVDKCARIELTRGALCASPGSEMYPFSPGANTRRAEGWVNFNAAWNVSLAVWQRERAALRAE